MLQPVVFQDRGPLRRTADSKQSGRFPREIVRFQRQMSLEAEAEAETFGQLPVRFPPLTPGSISAAAGKVMLQKSANAIHC